LIKSATMGAKGLTFGLCAGLVDASVGSMPAH
jgi:hypothetical protein